MIVQDSDQKANADHEIKMYSLLKGVDGVIPLLAHRWQARPTSDGSEVATGRGMPRLRSLSLGLQIDSISEYQSFTCATANS